MEIRPKSSLILHKKNGDNFGNKNTKINLEKLKLITKRLDKDDLVKKLLINTIKTNIIKSKNFDENKNIHYIKKKTISKKTPFQVYQKIKLLKKYEINNKMNFSSSNKLNINLKNKFLTITTNNSIQLNEIQITPKKKFNFIFQKRNITPSNSQTKIKTRNFNILNEYKNMTEFTRMVKRDILKIEKFTIKKIDRNNSDVKYNKFKEKFNSLKKLYIDNKSLIYELKNKFARFPKINRSSSLINIRKN